MLTIASFVLLGVGFFGMMIGYAIELRRIQQRIGDTNDKIEGVKQLIEETNNKLEEIFDKIDEMVEIEKDQ